MKEGETMIDVIHPISTVSARAIMKAAIRHYKLDEEEPSLIRAIDVSEILTLKHGLYVRPDYLFTVWQETIDSHDKL